MRHCELSHSAIGIVGCAGARVLCEASTLLNLTEAGVLLSGNGTLGELDSNTITGSRTFGAAATGGAGLVARGNRIAHSGQAAITVNGAGGWAHVLGNRIEDNGDYGVSAGGGGTARVEENRIAGHQHGVCACDAATRIWLRDNEFAASAVRDIAAAAGARVEWDGGWVDSPCVVVSEPGQLLVPAHNLIPTDCR